MVILSNFKFTFQNIIDANGCLARDEALRRGVRYLCLHNKGKCKTQTFQKTAQKHFNCSLFLVHFAESLKK